jgi:OOP family OmpA-OmpF porin
LDVRASNRLLGSASFLLFAAPAAAQEARDIDIQNFRPAMDSKGLVTLERSKALGTLEPSLGLYLNYAFDPLKQKIGGKEVNVVDNLGTGNFVLALGFANIVEIGANLPVVISRGQNDGAGDGENLSADGFGDAQFSLKVRILDRERHTIGLALVPSVVVGTGEADGFISHGQGAYFVPRLAIDWMFGSRVYMAVNGAARLRDRRELSDAVTPVTVTDAAGVASTIPREDPIIVGKDVQYGLGVGFILIPERLDLIFEGFGAVPIESGAERAMPVEALGALKVFLAGNSFLTLGGSYGLLSNAGDPAPRLFAGIVFEPAIRDRDGDGLNDDIDQCPDEKEDKDGFVDEDGCPDPDNDEDGILDIVDLCPDLPEDKNGFEDEDGCPEGQRDRDGDGIVDMLDRCPNEPEDKDGFEDEDGCPDPDNDRDGILDAQDNCPNEPEDIDGFEDNDGCPDPDNDKDGLLDNVDRCPNEPENYNGIEDEDGCPEVPKRVVISGGKINILDKIYFELAKAVIRPESYDILFQVAETLKQNPQITKVEIQGHTDNRGSETYNLDLSDRRVAAVRKFLIERGGIAADRLTSKGYGESMLIDQGNDEQAHAKNRRVEFVIMEEAGPTPTEFQRP